MTLKLALPTGDSRSHVFELLRQGGIEAPGYEPGSRVLRSASAGAVVRVFRERDIPVQVALGNYDLGICGETWLSEVQVRFPLQRIVRLGSLPGPVASLWLCASPESGLQPGQLPPGANLRGARIASEFPNLADLFAIRHRIPSYRLIQLAGSAEAYPPEDADLVVVPAATAREIETLGLVPVTRMFDGGLVLIANADAIGRAPMGDVLRRLGPLLGGKTPSREMPRPSPESTLQRQSRSFDVVRLAVPDGHAQRHTPACLEAAGLTFQGYDEKAFVRRPRSGIDGLEVKVVRPQDMPQLVAMGVFDIAISGRDLLAEHLARFPGSPVEMAADLQRNRYRIGPVVEESFPADTTAEAVARLSALGRKVRIASEFPALAEKFAREHHLRYAAIIPIAGASEGFVPEDADVLIEGAETGSSLKANGLKMLDTYIESTNCVLVRRMPVTSRVDVLDDLVHRLRASVEAGVS